MLKHWSYWSAQDLEPGQSRGSRNCPSGANFWKGCVCKLGLLKCPRSQAMKVSMQSKLFPQERIPERMWTDSGLLRCPRIQARRVSRQPKNCLSVANFLRMCEQIKVVGVPKISSQERVEAVTSGADLRVDVSTDCCYESAQYLKAGECEGSHKLSLRSEFPKGCVNRLALLRCPRSQARKVSRQTSCPSGANFWKAVWADRGCWSAQDCKPKKCRGSQKNVVQEQNFWEDVWTDRGCWSAQDRKPGECRGSQVCPSGLSFSEDVW